MEARKHFFLFIKNYTFFFLELSTFLLGIFIENVLNWRTFVIQF